MCGRSISLILSLVLYFHSSIAQIPSFGGCPNVSVQANFQTEKYLGLWYEIEKYPFLFELGGKCITADYNLEKDGTVTVLNRQISSITGNDNSIKGSAKVISPAKLGVTFPSVPFGGQAPYWVLGTDYTNYAVVYSCRDIGGFLSGKTVWILSRTPSPNVAIMQQAYSVLDSNRISKAYLIRTDQSNCKYNNSIASL